MNKLLTGLRNEYNYTFTENGAITYKSTLNDVLDLFYHAPAKRGQNNTKLFANAYAENALLAIKTAFYVRDVRGGQGERETFRQMLRWMYKNDIAAFNAVIDLVPVYGRWDDVLEYVDNSNVRRMISDQLKRDMTSDNPSLLAKWMPSANTSSEKTVKLANKWINALGLTQRSYRKMLSTLRSKIGIIEKLMSAKAFDQINYEHVPSRAASLYRKAFAKRDGERYTAYIADVKSGAKKINASTLYPYELVKGYAATHMGGYDRSTTPLYEVDDTIEALWNALPNYADTDDNALVVVDVSSSMFSSVSKVLPIYVSVSLGIYFADRNKGAFAKNFITFSRNPRLITLRGNTLKDKVDEVFSDVGYDTNVQAVFEMLLRVAVQNRVPQAEMPKRIFIVSDMEFNNNAIGGRTTNFDLIKRKYRLAGYEMPILVFWNVDSANMQAPVTQDENGVYVVSGASPSIFKNVLASKTVTPIDMMLEVLNGERYAAIEEALHV